MSSPYGLALLSACVFLFAVLFPPGLYYFYLGELDNIFLNGEAVLYFGLCLLGFFTGLACFKVMAGAGENGKQSLVQDRPLMFVLIPLFTGTAVCVASTSALASSLPNLGTLLLAQQGDLVKLAGLSGATSVGFWRTSSIITTGTLWWAYWRGTHLLMTAAARRTFLICFSVALACAVLACIVRVDRTALMPILAGLFVLYLHRRIAESQASLSRAVLLGLGIGMLLIGMFLLLSLVRGYSGFKLLLSLLLGYTIASYNRLAALLSGQLTYLYHGSGIYLSSAYSSDLNNIFHFQNLPTPTDAWFSEFSSTLVAGLNPMYIWSSAFGYLYSDIGWWTPLYFIALGLLYGWGWRLFLQQTAVGVLIYPWLAFNVLFWVGSNYVLDTKLIMLILMGLALAIYERTFSSKATTSLAVA